MDVVASRKSNKIIIGILCLYFIGLLVISSKLIPYFDTFYYWEWSRHLALSYYDGPPLIAYALKLFTYILGNNVFAISFLATVTVYLSGFFIYKTTKIIAGQKAGLIAMLLWTASPLVAQYLLKQTTYDNPFCLFWAATLYFAVKFIQFNKPRDLYLTGVSIGLMMLSKYSGVILVLSLLVFILTTKSHRALFKNRHLYFSMLIALLIFSPVIIWNYQHDWISFTYQLQNHQTNSISLMQHFFNYGQMLTSQMLPGYNFLLLIFAFGCFKSWQSIRKNNALYLLTLTTLIFVGFYLFTALTINVKTSWLMPFSISATILAGYFITKHQWRKSFFALSALYIALSAIILLANSFLAKKITLDGARVSVLQKFNRAYKKQHDIIVTSQWLSARMAFWLTGKPHIQTLPCGAQNQYRYWNKAFMHKIKDGQIKQILYVDFLDLHRCIQNYFPHCKQLPTLTHTQKPSINHGNRTISLYVYQCTT